MKFVWNKRQVLSCDQKKKNEEMVKLGVEDHRILAKKKKKSSHASNQKAPLWTKGAIVFYGSGNSLTESMVLTTSYGVMTPVTNTSVQITLLNAKPS